MIWKKQSDTEIQDRIKRIGGTGWVTVDDYRRFSNQATYILEALVDKIHFPSASRRHLEAVSGSTRVASRIDELRDEWDIKTTRMSDGTAAYTLIGRRTEPRIKKIKLRPAVVEMAHQMERVLRKNDWKGGWQDMTHTDILTRIHEEVEELDEVLKAQESWGDKAKYHFVRDEAIDVANFCMMLVDRIVTREPRLASQTEMQV